MVPPHFSVELLIQKDHYIGAKIQPIVTRLPKSTTNKKNLCKQQSSATATPHEEKTKSAKCPDHEVLEVIAVICLQTRNPISIGIVAASCRLPGGVNDTMELWDLLKTGKNPSSRIPVNRINTRDVLIEGKKYGSSTEGGNFISQDVSHFDPSFFDLSLGEAETIDPQQRLLLECIHECFENAGITELSEIGVFVGLMEKEYADLMERDTSINSLLGSMCAVMAGRISYVFGCHGPSITVDTACSSSLVAAELAINALKSGRCSRAIVAGINLILSEKGQGVRANGKMLSRHGMSLSFDARASGYGRSDGCAVLLLEKTKDDSNYLGIISDINVNHGGRAPSLTTPNPVAHKMLLTSLLQGFETLDVQYWEAHGTGTAVGDPIEANVLSTVFQNIRIGSMKTVIGHGEASAGGAALIKLALMLEKKYIPPAIHFHVLNNRIHLGNLTIPIVGEDAELNVCGMTSFGISGTNAAAILNVSKKPISKAGTFRKYSLLLISAKESTSLNIMVKNVENVLINGESKIDDVVATLASRKHHYSHRCAVVTDRRGRELCKSIGRKVVLEDSMGPALLLSNCRLSYDLLHFTPVLDHFTSLDDILSKDDKLLISFILFMSRLFEKLEVYADSGRELIAALIALSTLPLSQTSVELMGLSSVQDVVIALAKLNITSANNETVRRAIRTSRCGVTCLLPSHRICCDNNTVVGSYKILAICAQLYTSGFPFNFSHLCDPEVQSVRTPTYPFNRKSVWFNEKLNVYEHYLLGTIKSSTHLSITFNNYIDEIRHPQLFGTRRFGVGTALEIAHTALIQRIQGKIMIEAFHVDAQKMNGPCRLVTTVKKSGENFEVFAEVDCSRIFTCRASTFAESMLGNRPACPPRNPRGSITYLTYNKFVQNSILTSERTMTKAIIQCKFDNSPYNGVLELSSKMRPGTLLNTFIFFSTLPAKCEVVKDTNGTESGIEVWKDGKLKMIAFENGYSSSFSVSGRPSEIIQHRSTRNRNQAIRQENEFRKENHMREEDIRITSGTRSVPSTCKKSEFIEAPKNTENIYTSRQQRLHPLKPHLTSFKGYNRQQRTDIKDAKTTSADIPDRDNVLSMVIKATEETVARPFLINKHSLTNGFMELGLDSLNVVHFVNRLNEKYFPYLQLSTTDIFDNPTIEKLADHIREKKGSMKLKKSPRERIQSRKYEIITNNQLSTADSFDNPTIEKLADHIREKKGSKKTQNRKQGITTDDDVLSIVIRATQETVPQPLLVNKHSLTTGFMELAFEADSFDNPTIEKLADHIREKKGSKKTQNRKQGITTDDDVLSIVIRATQETVPQPLLVNKHSLTTGFMELGLDSLNVVHFVNRLNEKYFPYLQLSTTDIFDNPTIEKLADHIREKKGSKKTQNRKQGITTDDDVLSIVIRATQETVPQPLLVNKHSLTTGFIELGLDSLNVVHFVNRLNEKYFPYLQLSTTDIFDNPTIEKLADHIREKKGSKKTQNRKQGITTDDDVLSIVIRATQETVPQPLLVNKHSLTTGFMELGLDSLNVVHFVNRLNEKYFPYLQLSTTDIFDNPTIEKLADHIREKKGSVKLKKSPRDRIQSRKYEIITNNQLSTTSIFETPTIERLDGGLQKRRRKKRTEINQLSSERLQDDPPFGAALELENRVLPIERSSVHLFETGNFSEKETFNVFPLKLNGMFNEMDCQILRKHHVSKENLIPGAYQFYILLKWINSNSEQGTYFTLTNTSLSNPWKYEEGNEYELVQTDKNALHVIVNGETKCSSCASFNEHVVTPALDIISFRNECKTDCNMKQFYSKMAANGLAYDGQFQAIKSLKRNETRIFAVLDYKKPYAVWTLMDAALHAICLTVVDRRPDVYFLPIYVREIYLDHNLNPSPSQSIIALAEKVMENEKFIEADACIFVDDVLLFQCRKKLSLVLNSSQKTKHIVSEKSEGRRKVFPSIGSTFSSNHKMSPEEKSIYILGFNGKFCFSASDNKEFWQQLKIGIIGEESFTRECSPSSNYLMNMDITKWDPEFFGITPKEAPHIDVLQRLMMISVKNCLDNANLTKVPKNTGVFVGLSGSDFTNRVYSEVGEKASGYYSSGTNGSCVAGRIAHWLKLEGPVLVIDTACSSSFTALVNAADAIVNQKCDYAIVGGINLILHDTVTEVLKNAGMLSSKGVCQVFDANADGYIRSEVVGCILLSRYGTDARFKIARWAIGHNGEAASLQVPNGSSQERIMKQICEKEVGNVECHGTGTSLGDPIEIQAIARVHGHVTVSSVKSHVGHAEGASGIASLVSCLMQMENNYRSNQAHFKCPNPKIDFSDVKVNIVGEESSLPNFAINNFGFSGTNCSVLLRRQPFRQFLRAEPCKYYLAPISANDKQCLLKMVRELKEFVNLSDNDIGDICTTLQKGRTTYKYRHCILFNYKRQVVWEYGQAIQRYDPPIILDQTDFISFEYGKGFCLHYLHSKKNHERLWSTAELDTFNMMNLPTALEHHKRIGVQYVKGNFIKWPLHNLAEINQTTNIPAYSFKEDRYWPFNKQFARNFGEVVSPPKDIYFEKILFEVTKVERNNVAAVVNLGRKTDLQNSRYYSICALESSNLFDQEIIVLYHCHRSSVSEALKLMSLWQLLATRHNFVLIVACLSNGTSYTEWTGLLRTLASEQQLPYKFVSYTELKDLNAELSYADIFECIFYNNSKRYVERLSAVKPKRIPSPTAGHLLITGGTGGVGRKIIELIKPNKATIVTRSSDSFGGENMSQTELLFLTSDLRSLELPRDEHYDVVVHCAGVVDNSLLANMNRLKFDNVCLPKSLGLSVLHEAMALKKPAKLIIASSAACILGSVGQANYAFANGMMTSLAEQFDMSTQIIHWGPWKNVGLLHGSYAEKLSRQLRSRGWNSLEPADALDVLNTNAKNILVFDGDFKHISRTQNHLQKFLSKVVKPEETCSNSPKNRSNRQRNLRKNENDLQRIIKEVSGIGDIAEKRFVPLMNLGVDSLMLEEIRKTINKELGYTITSREVYDNGTFDELSKILAQGEPKSHKAENAVSNADQRKENRTNTSTAENSLSQQKSPRKNETGLRRIIKEISGIADIEEKRFVPLMNLGVDSLMLEEIRKNISKELGYRITSREVYDNCTFDELSKIMARGELTSQKTQKAVNHANHREPDDQSADIAIIGYSGAFSGCESVEELWKNLLAGNECIQRAKSREDVFVDAAGIIPDIDKFDYKFWNMTEDDASALDPQIRVFLQTAYHALEKSGYIRKRNDLKIGVYAGAEPSEYGDPNSEAEGSLRRLFEMNMKDFVSTFTAHMLDLRGPAVGIYSACSTSLLAVTQACNSLRLSDVDIAIAGAVSLVLPNQTRYEFQEGLVLSKSGKCRPFDRGADGIVRGSAVGCVVLKMYNQALRDNDNIEAVIRGYSMNNDGVHKASFMAPNSRGEYECMKQALASLRADDVNRIGYIECHGTGTRVGDEIELDALRKAYTTNPGLIVGSVKANIGHGFAGSGMAGLLKTIKILQEKRIPPQINIIKPRDDLTFTLNLKPTKLKPNSLAAVSSFGIGGTNVHIVLENSAPIHPAKGVEGPMVYILPISGATADACIAHCRAVSNYIKDKSNAELERIATTLQSRREHFKYRVSIAASSTAEAVSRLEAVSSPVLSNDIDNSNICFFFAPQGVQYPNMEKVSLNRAAVFTEELVRLTGAASKLFQEDFMSIMYPSDAHNDQIMNPKYAQVALFIICQAILAQLDKWGISSDLLLGHSVGEYSAAFYAGMMSESTCMNLLKQRGELVSTTNEARMLVIFGQELNLPDNVEVSAILSQNLRCVVGSPDSIASLARQLDAQQISYRELTTERGFHSSMMDCLEEDFTKLLRNVQFLDGHKNIISNIDGEIITNLTSSYCWNHMRQPVNLMKCIDTVLLNSDIKIIVEVGPSGVLRHLLTERRSDVQVISTVLGRNKGLELSANSQLFQCVADLWAQGLNIDFSKHFPCSEFDPNMPTYPFEKLVCWREKLKNNAFNYYTASWTPRAKIDQQLEHLDKEDVLLISSNPDEFLKFVREFRHVEFKHPSEILHSDIDDPGRFSLIIYILSNDTSDFTVPFLVSRSICSATVAHRTRFIAISLTGEPVHWTVLGPIREYHLGRERKNVFVDNSEKIPIQQIIHSALHLREEVLFATKNSLLSMTYTETHFPDQKIRVGKTAAVIGGRGAIGSTYVDVLRKTTGVKNVVVLSRMPSRKVCIPGVSFYALDISDKNSVETTMSELYSRYGDLNTIVHSAGKTTSMSLKKSTSEMLSVLLPKIGGITNILEYLCRKNMNLENLLMTSSMSSFIALQGTEDYSAANVFMDALSLNGHPNVRRILSVQWPAWKNAGMAATIEQNDLNGILMRTSISPQIGKQIIKETLRKEGLIVHSLLPPLYIRELAEKAQLAEKAPNLPKAMSRNLSQRDKVAKIWSEVLGAEIYDDTDFFEHGGNSLSALRVIWRVNGLLNTNMTVDRLFEHTLFKDFVKALPCENVPSSAEVFDKTSPAELTHSQENMFLLQELERGAKYNILFTIHFREKAPTFSKERLIHSVHSLIARQHSLRTCFVQKPGFALAHQMVLSLTECFQNVEWKSMKPQEYDQMICEEKNFEFNLKEVPLRVRTGQIDGDYVIAFNQHHILTDGWSVTVLANELKQIYALYSESKNGGLKPLPYSLSQYAHWQRQHVQFSKELEELKRILSGRTATTLPYKLENRKSKETQGSFRKLIQILPEPMVVRLKSMAKINRTTDFVVVLSAFLISLRRLKVNGEDDSVVVGCPVVGRNEKVKDLIGYFLNNAIVSASVRLEDKLEDVILLLKKMTPQLKRFENVPFHKLVAKLGSERQSESHPIFQIFFNYRQQLDFPSVDFSDAIVKINQHSTNTVFDLSVSFDDTPKGMRIMMEYNSFKYRTETVRMLMNALLGNLIPQNNCAPTKRQIRSDYPVCVLSTNNDFSQGSNCKRTRTLRRKNLLSLGHGKVHTKITKIAEWANDSWSKLNGCAIRSDDIFAVEMDSGRAVEVILAMRHIGAGYAPVDPTWPPLRKAHIMGNIPLTFAIKDAILPCFSKTDRMRRRMKFNRTASTDIAYVIHTSGSSGSPKGVAISQKNVSSFLHGATRQILMKPGHRVSHSVNIVFDVSVFNIFGSLVNKCELCIHSAIKNAAFELVEMDCNIAFLPSAIFNALPIQDIQRVSVLEKLVVGGETVNDGVLGNALQLGLDITQIYGPTECTVWSLTNRCKNLPSEGSLIGKTMANEICGIKASTYEGELIIRGSKIARGYIGDVGDNRRFSCQNTTSPSYLTGDMVRREKEGFIYRGRIDRQLKFLGHRVELEEIERAILCSSPEVSEVSVLPLKSSIVAFIVSKHPIQRNTMCARLHDILPPFMIPSRFVHISSIPLNSSGKIDKDSLMKEFNRIYNMHSEKPESKTRTSSIEDRLISIIRKLIDVADVTVDNSFFALGGHSLLLFDLKREISQEFAVNVDVHELFSDQTISELAELISNKMRDGSSDIDTSIIIKLRETHRGKLNVYLIHAVGGSIFPYHTFLHVLPKQINIFAIEYKMDFEATSLKELAAFYSKAVAAHTRDVPSFLMGHSMGGTIAREMVEEMKMWRKEVPFVVMFDTWMIQPELVDIEAVTTFAKEMFSSLPDSVQRAERTTRLAEMLKEHKLSLSATKIYLFKSMELTDTPLHKFIRSNLTETMSRSITANGLDQYSEVPIKIYLIDGTHESCLRLENLNVHKGTLLSLFENWL
ncbi:hypothetical protein RB195_019702 [Necator americanus]|uniref:oleoyl-[acyl-carrier-protein] hydrolase n=1 Tax=Necator americanus TaxID=51031 RepID=A0ABR1CFD8_NECAM